MTDKNALAYSKMKISEIIFPLCKKMIVKKLLGAITLSIITFGQTTVSVSVKRLTPEIAVKDKFILSVMFFFIMLSVEMLSVLMLSVVLLSDVRLIVMAPYLKF
jgi:hypothetical protein